MEHKTKKLAPTRTVGIPRSLCFDEWRSFFDRCLERHNLEVVYSPASSKGILERGLGKCIDEVCLPLKVFYGHLDALWAQKVDYLFIPRLISAAPGRNYCPKFHLLPDLALAALPEAKIISPFIDLHHHKKETLETHVRKALLKSLKEHGLAGRASKKILVDAWTEYQGSPAAKTSIEHADPMLKIAVVGHHYAQTDKFLNMNLLARLKELGATTLVGPAWADELPVGTLEEGIYYETIVRSARTIESCIDDTIDGIILVTFFACGPDSYGAETLLYRLDNQALDVPAMRLIFDEHTAEEGLVTRLTTFVEMARDHKAAKDRTLC